MTTRAKEIRELGNTGYLEVDANGNVGIGTTSPDLKLHVDGTNGYPATSGNIPVGHIAIRAKNESSSHGGYIGVADASPWGTWIQGQDANNLATNYPLSLNPNGGNVGIGTNVPGYGLDVHNTSRFTDILKVEEPIWSYSDIGTKYYTHLATGSLYQGTGAILIKTNIPGHNQSGNANMFAIRLVGYNYNSKGNVDLWLGCYAGEGNFYSTACHGVCPSEWKDDIYVYTDTNGKVVFRIGTTSTPTFGEYAVAEFVQGFGNVNTSYSKGWTITSVSTLETESNTAQLSKVAFMPNSLTVQRGIFNEGNYSQLVSNPSVDPGYRRYQVLSCNNVFASNESGVWKDVAYVSYSPNLDIHGMTIENGSPSYGSGVFNGVIRGTYGAVAVHEITKYVAAQNGGHITDIAYRYLNSGAASGSYRLQVKLTFSSTSWSINVTTLLSGQAWNTISED